MAKDSPYFKFYVSEYNDGDIQLCSMTAQGLFTNLCSMYWSNEGKLFLSKMKRKFKVREKIWEELIEEKCIKISGDEIKINFLDKQLRERKQKALTNARNGEKGGRPKSENNPVGFDSVSETKANESNIEEKRGEDNKKREEERESLEITRPIDDPIFLKVLKKNYPSLDLEKCWEACENWHNAGPAPPQYLWQWKQKFQTWLDIESKKVPNENVNRNNQNRKQQHNQRVAESVIETYRDILAPGTDGQG